MYLTFIVSLACLFVMSYPQTRYIVQGIEGPIEFTFGISFTFFVILSIVLGFVMSLGKAAVYKHIPVYYPNHVGSVGRLVGTSVAWEALSCRSPSAFSTTGSVSGQVPSCCCSASCW